MLPCKLEYELRLKRWYMSFNWFIGFFFMFQVSNLQHEVVVYNALSWINLPDE